MTPENLIDMLAADLHPIRRLQSPLLRSAAWVLLAASVFAIIASVMGLRADISERWQNTEFLVSLVAAITTAVLAAAAAFMLSIPDRSRLWLALPLPTLVVWVSAALYILYANSLDLELREPSGNLVVRGLVTLALAAIPLAASMIAMLRRAQPIDPVLVSMAGGLAVGAITASALTLLHDFDTTTAMWASDPGTAIVISALGIVFARRLFPQ